MNIDSEYGLYNQKPMPWWMGKFSSLRRLWFNPVFQRNYQRSRVKQIIKPKHALYTGLGLSILLSIVTLSIGRAVRAESGSIVEIIFFTAFVGPISLMYIIFYIRMFIVCVISTPIEMKKDIGDNTAYPILTTPLRDSDLFYAECLPNFVRGLEILESYISLSIGLLIPCAVIAFFSLIFTDLEITDLTMKAGIMFVVAFQTTVNVVLMMLLLSLASGLYTIWLPTFSAVAATLVHYWTVSSIANIIPTLFGGTFGGLWGLGSLFNMPPTYGTMQPTPYGLNPYVSFFGTFFFYLLITMIGKIVITWIFLIWTTYLGKSEFSKLRRQGYYEPEFSNAAGLE